MADVQGSRQLVVIGASAGGIDALSTLVGTLSPDFPAPIIIAQHLDPSRLSHLEEILARRSKVPVRTVHDREHLQNGTVYVVPSDRHVEILDNEVNVHSDSVRGRPSPSIDLLLASAAEVYGEQLIAVILTGLGSDGADGARRVKEHGGTVIIQNPETASHPEMPLSLAPTTVDIVAELAAIGPLLKELLTGTYVPVEVEDDRRLRMLLEQVRARSGIDFSTYKEPTIRRRLQRRMLDTSSQSLDDYIRYLRRHPEEYDRLANSFLIKVTDFFRDADLFNHLRDHVLPGLIDEARTSGNGLRVWSAGCATGEEPYSLAILVSELLGHQLEHFSVRIFATDVDADAIAFARRGIYPSSAVKNVPAELRDRYLARMESGWEVRKQSRAMVVFGQHDLGQRAPFPRIDLVLCRNVLIYFTPELQRRGLQLFAFALREGGYLVLGKSETTSPLPEHFTLSHPRLKIFQRHGDRVLIPPLRVRDTATIATGPASSQSALAGVERELARAHARHRGDGPTSSERSEQVLFELPLGVVVVDRNYDIHTINAAARRLLGIHGPALNDDVTHLAHRVLADPLRDVLDAGFAELDRRTVHELTSLPDAPGETRYFEFSSFPIHAQSDRSAQPEAVAVIIADVTDRERQARAHTDSLADAQMRALRVQELLDESTRTVRDLLRANQDLAIDNAGLRGANEQLLVSNEESQAAMEEIETLNEEQQATNEELETLNEELQATVEELNTTNEDLQARTVELQDQANARASLVGALDEERQQLEAVMTSMSDAVMLVDTNAVPVLTNAAFKELFGDALPQLEDATGKPLSTRANLAKLAARGETFTQAFTIAAPDGSRRWYEATGRPIRQHGMAGGVVVIRDVTDRSLRQMQEQFVALTSHELRTPLAALRGSLQLLQKALGDVADERVAHYLELGVVQTRFLDELVQDLADVIRVQTGHLPIVRERVDLVELARSAVEIARPISDSMEIRLEVPEEPVPLSGDRRRLQQVILNLVSNAAHHGASPRGVDVRVRHENSTARIEVADYGPGIPAGDRERVFELFNQASAPSSGRGLGVGLYLVRAIISAHDGTVQLTASEPQGTTAVVRLPLAD